jgi:hopanoid biosynthesis associated protein HpnK
MASGDYHRRLIVNADDFGRSHSINEAVVRAHREGILTTTSLMVNGDAATEAVELARQNPQLGVGLHLTLVCGRSTLPGKEIPGLTNRDGQFSDNAVSVGMRYFFQRSLVPQLRREIAAQLGKFYAAGLALDHVNGHLNLHLHPTVFRLLMDQAEASRVRRVRLTRDPLRLNLQLARGRWMYRLSHAVIFGSLSWWAKPRLLQQRIGHTNAVFGLLQTGYVGEGFLLQLLSRLPKGDSELYSHPCLEKFRAEADALVSPTVRRAVQDNSIQLIRYQDL